MKILFTGGSSFTGYWFVKELTEQNQEVLATFTKNSHDYSGIQKERIDKLALICNCQFDCEFGSTKFMNLIENESHIDILCHHGAYTTNYKSQDFDVLTAVSVNTKNISSVLDKLRKKGCYKVLLTGSIFEQKEGVGSDGLRAFSPYGLSKGLTCEILRYYTLFFEMKLGKFVIPNPFGPYEGPKFTSYLVEEWYKGKTPFVATPNYVRDNIHVSLLAKAYVYFIKSLRDNLDYETFHPSCYPESQGSFAIRFAKEIGLRLGLPCEIKIDIQKDFFEPIVRINTDYVRNKFNDWSEEQSWNELAHYYQTVFGNKLMSGKTKR